MRNWFTWYKNLAIILLNTFLLVLLISTGLYFFYRYKDTRAKKTNPVSQKYGAENLARVYPDLKPDEIDELLTETWNRPHQYSPFTGFKEAPFQGKYVNVHPAGFRQNENQNPWPDSHHFNQNIAVLVFTLKNNLIQLLFLTP